MVGPLWNLPIKKYAKNLTLIHLHLYSHLKKQSVR